MSMVMEAEFKRWTAKRKAALVLEIVQGKTTVAEASRSFDLTPLEIEDWVDEGKRSIENALRTKPLEIKEQYRSRSKIFRRHTAKRCWSYMPEKNCSPWWVRTRND